MKKLNDLSAGSSNSCLFKDRVRLFSERMVAGQLKLNETGTATLLPALPLLDDSPLLLSLGTGTKPVQEATLAKTTFFFFFPRINFFARLVSEQDQVSASAESGERMDLKSAGLDLFKLSWNYTLRCMLRNKG